MNAKICDRCGKIYDPYTGHDVKNKSRSNGVMLIDKQNSRFHVEREFFELCPRCMEDLEEFLKGE